MKLTKGKYDLTIDQVGVMLETGDYSILKRYRLVPGIIARRAFMRFLVDFAETFNSQKLDQVFEEELMLSKIRTKIQMLTLLYQGLLNELTYGVKNQIFADTFRENFFKDFSGMEDLKLIIKQMEKLTVQYKEYSIPKPTGGGPGMSFSEIVANVEMMLERTIPRDMRFYEFKRQFDLAVARAREIEKIRNKNG